MNVIISSIILSGLCALVQSADWHYPPPESNGVVTENEHWGGACDRGRRQSPIDLAHGAAVKGSYPSFIMNSGYNIPIQDAAVTNTGHSIQINNENPASVVLSGGGLSGSYFFDQVHFHWASEHTIDETRFGLEMHAVHHNSQYKDLNSASEHKKGIAVLGILFTVTDYTNPIIENIIHSGLVVKDKIGGVAPLKKPLSLNELLPKNKTTYFRYEGSLTTPTCGEAVVWTVFPNTIEISADQVDQLKTMIKQGNDTLASNYRKLQPLNARTLVFVTEDDSNYSGGSVGLSAFSSLISSTIFIVFAFFYSK